MDGLCFVLFSFTAINQVVLFSIIHKMTMIVAIIFIEN